MSARSARSARSVRSARSARLFENKLIAESTIRLKALVNNDSILEFEQSSRHSHVCLSIDQLQQYRETMN